MLYSNARPLWTVIQSLQIRPKLRLALPYSPIAGCYVRNCQWWLSCLKTVSGLFQRIVLAKRREIHQQGKFADGSPLFWLCWVLAVLIRWILAGSRRWCKAFSKSESQTIKAELGTASRMPHFPRKCLAANLLACLHDLRRRHCHHHRLVLYTEDRHILPLKPLLRVVQMKAPDPTVCKPIWSQTKSRRTSSASFWCWWWWWLATIEFIMLRCQLWSILTEVSATVICLSVLRSVLSRVLGVCMAPSMLQRQLYNSWHRNGDVWLYVAWCNSDAKPNAARMLFLKNIYEIKLSVFTSQRAQFFQPRLLV